MKKLLIGFVFLSTAAFGQLTKAQLGAINARDIKSTGVYSSFKTGKLNDSTYLSLLGVRNNLSDLNNIGTARTNLGLGTLATLNTINNSNWSGTALAHSNIAATAVTPGSYTSANITIAADGSITAASNGSGSTPTINSQSGTTYILVIGDANNIVETTNASAVTITVPTNASVAFPLNTQITFFQYGTGLATLSAAGGVTVNSSAGGGNLSMPGATGQFNSMVLEKRGTNEWYLFNGSSLGIVSIANGGTGSTNGAWLLSGNSILSGAATVTSNLPSSLIINGVIQATANNQNHSEITGTITSRNTASDVVDGLVIDHTLIRHASNPATQTGNGLRVNTTFSNSFTTQNVAKFQNAGTDLMSLNSAGNLLLGTSSAQTSYLQIRYSSDGGNNNGYASYIQNTNSVGSVASYWDNNRGGFAAYGGTVIGGSSNGASFFGVSRADRFFLIADGASLLGMYTGTLVSQSYNIGTNNLVRSSWSATGAQTHTETASGTGHTSYSFTQAAHSGGTQIAFSVAAGALTSYTTATDIVDVNINLSAIAKLTDGTTVNGRGVWIQGRTYTPQTSALTVTNPFSLDVSGPVAGSGTTFTNPAAINVSGANGHIRLGTAGARLFISEGTNGGTGTTTLVSGTKAITVTTVPAVSSSTRCFATLVTGGGTVTTTWQYGCVCSANTVTITALTTALATNTSDTSTVNYVIIN